VNDAHRGVVLVYDSGVMWWTLTGPAPPQELRPARWGRMLVITGAISESTPPRVAFARPVAPPPGRMRSIRLGTAPVGARSIPLGPTVIWIAGDEIPPKSWIEITSDSASTSYLGLEEIAAAPPAIPLRVALRERHVLEGRVAGASGEAARGALITIFRLIDPPPSDRSQSLPRRVLATESIADDEGRFAVGGLGEADYELVAWHAQLGRASLALSTMSTQLDIRLTPNGMARGRVVAAGRPVEGVDVISVPDPAAFSAAEDITELKGGDTRTGPDGRFSVSLAPSGGGELRIGGGKYPVKRVPLPRPAVPLVDVGVIDLGRAIGIAIVLDRDIACDVRAAGPVGRSGLQLIAATNAGNGTFEVAIPEPGFWEFTLMCGQDARSLSPSIVQIGASDAGRQVRMIVR